VLFLRPPANANDIREFCQRFAEGIRVEYKSALDGNVRTKLAKMLSSFANSLGGVAIIGVTAIDGVPQEPIEGFDVPSEELTLVVEQICLQGLNPPLVPKISQVQSDVPGKCFLVVEVDESVEAPHAIENGRKVYVRTGNASNPYDLAEVDLIIDLFTRRRELLSRRNYLIDLQKERARNLFPTGEQMVVEISLGPTFPRRAIVNRDFIWDFVTTQTYRGGGFLPGARFRRTNDGALGVSERTTVAELTQYGFLYWKTVAELRQVNRGNVLTNYAVFGSVLCSALKALLWAARLYSVTHYKGPIQIDLRLTNCFRQSMPFIDLGYFDLYDFQSVERTVHAEETANAETLGADCEGF